MVGWLKCNIDAGFYLNKNTTAAACCLAPTSWKLAKLFVIEGEGMTLLEAIKLAGLKTSRVKLT
jgi:hypothetical protein